mgnify:CR=1 FL=1
MDLNAVLTDLDSLFSHHMTDKIEGFLTDNIRAAMAENDSAAVLSLVSELVGFYRDSGEFQKCAAYADTLREATGLNVTLWDERRSTVEAHAILFNNGKNGRQRKKTVDAVAASLMLEGYLTRKRLEGQR